MHRSLPHRDSRLGPPRVNVWLKRLDRPGDNLTRPGHPGPTQDVPRPPRSQSIGYSRGLTLVWPVKMTRTQAAVKMTGTLGAHQISPY